MQPIFSTYEWFSTYVAHQHGGWLHYRAECTSSIRICLHEKALALLLNNDFVFEEFYSRFPSEKLLLTVFHLINGIFYVCFHYLHWHVLWYLALLAFRMDNKFSFSLAIWLKSNFKRPSSSIFGILVPSVLSPSLLDHRTSLVLLWKMKHRFQFVIVDLPILS